MRLRRLGGGDGASSNSSFSSQSSMGASAGSTCLTRARLLCTVGARNAATAPRTQAAGARGGSEPCARLIAALYGLAVQCCAAATPRGGREHSATAMLSVSIYASNLLFNLASYGLYLYW